MGVYERVPNQVGQWWTLNTGSGDLYALGRLALAAVDAKRVYPFSAQTLDLTVKISPEKAAVRVGESTGGYQNDGIPHKVDEANLHERQRVLELRWLWTVMGGSFLLLAVSMGFLLRMRRSQRLLEATNALLRQSQHEIQALNVSLEQRVQARTDALRQQTRYLRTLIDALPAWLWLKDTEGRYLTVNVNIAATRHFSPQQMIGKTDAQLLPGDDAESFVATDMEVMQTRQRKTWEQAVPGNDGTVSWHEIDKLPVLDVDGTLLGTVGIGRDITERKRMEDALAQRERDFRSLVENIPLGLIRYDSQHRRRYLNPVAERLLPGNSAETLGQRHGEGYMAATPAMLEYYERMMDEVLLTGQTRNLDLVSDALPTLLQRNYEVRFVPERGGDGKTFGVLAIWRDITERKQYELTLLARAELEQRQSQFFSVAPGFFYTTVRHPDGRYEITFASSGIRELLGLEPDAVMQDSWVLFNAAHPDDRPVTSGKSEASERDLTPYHLEYRIVHPLKGLRWMEVHLLTQRLPDGGTRWDGFMHDITERKRLEDQLAQRERDFRSLANNMPDNVARWDVDGCYLYINPVHERTLGASAKDVIGKPIPDSHVNVKAAIAQVVATGQAALMVQQSAPDEHGVMRLHDVSVVPERDSSGKIVSVLGIGRDMTEVYRMQAALATREQEFRSLAESSPDFIVRYDREGRHLYFNERLLRHLGLGSANEALGKRPSEVWPDGRFASVEQAAERAVQSMSQVDIEFVESSEAGATQYSQVSVVPERDARGQVIGSIAFGRDITTIREAERKLKDALEFSEGVVNAIPDILFELDREGRYLNLWTHTPELLAAQRGVLLDRTVHDVLSAESAATVMASLQEAKANGVSFGKVIYIDLPHGVSWFELSVSRKSGDGTFLVLSRDITERKRIEQALTAREQEFRSLAENLPVAVIRYDAEHRRRYLNRAAEGMLHGHAVDLLGQLPGSNTFPAMPAMIEHYLSEMKEVLATGVARDLVLVFDALPTERQEFFEVRFVPEQGAGGQASGVLAIWFDITERKRMENQLAARAQEFRALAENSPDTIARYTKGGIRTYINPVFARLAGKPVQDMLGVTVMDYQASPAALIYQSALLRSLESGEAGECEYTWPTQGGGLITSHIRIVPEFGADGKVVSVLSVGRDITGRKEAERKLKDALDFSEGIINAIPDLLFEVDRNGRYLNVWAHDPELLAASKEQLLNKTVHEVLSPEAATIAMACIHEADERGRSFGKEICIELPQGQAWFEQSMSKKTGSSPSDCTFLTLSRDITLRKRLEEELKRHEAEFRALTENLPDPVFRYDRDCRRIYVNPAAERVTRTPRDELIGRLPAESAAAEPESARRVSQAIREVFTTGERRSIFVEYIGMDGSSSEYQGVLVPEFNATGQVASVLSIAHEVTSLRAAERRAANFFANVPGFVFSLRVPPHGVWSFPFVSSGIKELYGLQPEDVKDDMMLLHLMIHPEDRPRVEAEQAECLRTLDPFYVEFRVQRPGHPERWIECRSMPERQVEGVILWHGIMLDITARKQAQERMELLEFAIDLSSDAIYLINDELRFTYVNASACRTLGYSREDLLAMGPTGIDPDIDLDAARDLMRNSSLGVAVSFETRHRTRDGHTFPVELMATHFERDGAKFSLSVVRDITERRTMELSLKESEARYRYHFNQLQSMLESSSEVSVFALDRQYRYLFFNKRHRDGAKYLRGTDIAIGMDMLESINNQVFREFCRQGFDQVLAGHGFYVESKEEVVRDGQLSFEYNDNYGSPIFNDEGEVVGLTVFAINTTERKHMQEMLRDSHRFLYNIIDTIADPIFVKDRQHRWLHINEAFCRFIGYSREELIGKSDFDFFPEQEARVFWAGDEAVFTSGQEFTSEEEFTNSRGETRYIFTRKTLFPGTDQQPSLVGIISDFTERRRMEDELHLREQKFRTLAENAPDNIVRYDRAGRIIYVNPVFERSQGLPATSLLGIHVRDIRFGESSDAYRDTLGNVFASGEAGEIEITLPEGPDGLRVQQVRMVAERNDAGGLVGVLAIGRDITEIKRYEAARDAALAEAMRLAKTRSEFLAHMSHELRTPLNGILGYTQILQRDKTVGERNTVALAVIRQSGEHLLALIDDILDLARIEAGRFTLDVGEISLAGFLRGVSHIVSVRAQEKGIDFICDFSHDLPAGIRGDEKRLRQVLLNLLANAVKFTHHGKVVLHVASVDVSHLAFVVEDTGVGIPASQLESIFHPFEQSGEARQRFGGSGLGLSISRQLTRLMGGDIWVESRLGEGSRFGFELELPTTTARLSPQLMAPEADIRREQAFKVTTPADASAKMMLVPPIEALQALHRLAQLGNMRDILHYAQQIAEADPQYQPFTAQLCQMAQSYQSKAILAFLNEYFHDASSE